jgi:hypothetical protein
MEHRRGQRKPAQLDVTIGNRQGPKIQGEIVDISAGGAFIRLAGDHSALRPIVQLKFGTRSAEPEYCECLGMIVRTEKDGVAVMFAQRQERAVRDVRPRKRVYRLTSSEQAASAIML